MKLFNILWGIGLLVTLTSCSSSNEVKEISPTSTEFTSGELAKLIEVVDEPCQLSYAEKDGTIATQYIKLKIKLRLRKESPELKEVDAQNINFTGLLSVAIVNLVDKNETKVQDLNVKSEDMLKLKKLLQGEKGAEETITFEGEFHNSDDAPTWFKEAAAFTPYLTGDVIVENEGNMEALNLKGTLGGSDDAIFSYNNQIDEGEVVFTVNGIKNVRKLKMGTYDKNTNRLVMKEYLTNGDYAGDFDGIWKDGIYQGTFTNVKGNSVKFVFQGSASNVDLSYNNNEPDYASSNSYDEIIDRFANFVSKLERIKSIDESYLKLLDKEYKEINKMTEGISVYDLTPKQQKRIKELKDKFDKESERIKDLRYGF